MKVKVLIIFISFFSFSTFAQTEVSIGGYAGGGLFSGNSVSIGGFTTSIFLEANIPLFEEVFPRASLIFTKDFNAVLPNTRKAYYPLYNGIKF